MSEILNFLQQMEGTHVTVADICDYFKKKGIAVGMTTVYRQLDKMVSEGLVAKYVIDGSSSACFEYTGDSRHECREQTYHCKCEKCGKTHSFAVQRSGKPDATHQGASWIQIKSVTYRFLWNMQ